MKRRITPATFYVTPPSFSGTPVDSTNLRSDISTANTNPDSSNTIEMTGGDYTLTLGTLDITKNLTLERDTSDTSGLAITVDDDSSGSPGIFDISSGVTLTVIENQGSGTYYNGSPLPAPAGCTKMGTTNCS